MRKWLLDSLLFKWAYRQGGIDSFALAQKDILTTMEDDIELRVQNKANKRFLELLTIIDDREIITTDKRGGIYIGGEAADALKVANLKAEAEFVSQSELWKVLHETPKQLAYKAMFQDDGKVETQLLKGRAILYTLDTQKKVLELLKNYQLSTPQL